MICRSFDGREGPKLNCARLSVQGSTYTSANVFQQEAHLVAWAWLNGDESKLKAPPRLHLCSPSFSPPTVALGPCHAKIGCRGDMTRDPVRCQCFVSPALPNMRYLIFLLGHPRLPLCPAFNPAMLDTARFHTMFMVLLSAVPRCRYLKLLHIRRMIPFIAMVLSTKSESQLQGDFFYVPIALPCYKRSFDVPAHKCQSHRCPAVLFVQSETLGFFPRLHDHAEVIYQFSSPFFCRATLISCDVNYSGLGQRLSW